MKDLVVRFVCCNSGYLHYANRSQFWSRALFRRRARYELIEIDKLDERRELKSKTLRMNQAQPGD